MMIVISDVIIEPEIIEFTARESLHLSRLELQYTLINFKSAIRYHNQKINAKLPGRSYLSYSYHSRRTGTECKELIFIVTKAVIYVRMVTYV